MGVSGGGGVGGVGVGVGRVGGSGGGGVGVEDFLESFHFDGFLSRDGCNFFYGVACCFEYFFFFFWEIGSMVD